MIMAAFKPVMVANKSNLDSVPAVPGQYIIVRDVGEIYLDHSASKADREKVSQNTFIQKEEPINPKNGDIWFETEEE